MGGCFSQMASSSSWPSGGGGAGAAVIGSGASGTVIFLHGLGDTGMGWAPVMDMVKEAHLKYVCPHAPVQAVTLNGGMQMPSWFDIRSLDASGNEDEAGIKKAAESVHAMLKAEEESGTPPSRIVLGGFSQGGGLALYSALTYEKKLGGVVALSSWLPLHKEIASLVAKGGLANQDTPILQGHGDMDPLVLHQIGQLTATYLAAFNPNHSFKTYPGMGHSSCDQEIQDLKQFFAKILPKP